MRSPGDVCGPTYVHPTPLRTLTYPDTGPDSTHPALRPQKAWILVMVCMASRCLDLEVLEKVDRASMASALQRFTSKRGTPIEIWSDFGTNLTPMKKALEAAAAEEGVSNSARADAKRVVQEMQELEEGVKDFARTNRCRWLHAPAPYHSASSGMVERHVRVTKDLLKVLLMSRKLTGLELQTKLDVATSLYHSVPVTDHPSDPSLWASRETILHGPRRASVFNLNSPVQGTAKVKSWGHRWNQMDAEIKYFFSVVSQKYLMRLLFNQKDRKEKGQSLEMGHLCYCPDLVLNKVPYHHGLVSVVDKLISTDGSTGRFYRIAYKRAGDIDFRTVKRHADSLFVVCRKSKYLEKGLNLFDVFSLPQSEESLEPSKDKLVLQRFAPALKNLKNKNKVAEAPILYPIPQIQTNINVDVFRRNGMEGDKENGLVGRRHLPNQHEEPAPLHDGEAATGLQPGTSALAPHGVEDAHDEPGQPGQHHRPHQGGGRGQTRAGR